jgi:hypothetical protein
LKKYFVGFKLRKFVTKKSYSTFEKKSEKIDGEKY